MEMKINYDIMLIVLMDFFRNRYKYMIYCKEIVMSQGGLVVSVSASHTVGHTFWPGHT